MADYHIRTDCRLCFGPLERLLDLGYTPLANEYPEQPGLQDEFPLFLSRCQHCGHVQLPVVVNPERLFRNYAYQSGTSPVFRAHLREFAQDTMPHHPRQDGPPLIVDIASNDGTLLSEFEALGPCKLLGVDPARNLAAQALEKGIATITEFFTPSLARDIVRDRGKAHLITALNVCAHVDDLNSFMAGVAELLHDDGMFVMEVGYLPDVIERGLYRVVYHEHLSYHNLASLFPFLRKHGLYLTHAHRVPSQGGSIRAYVRRTPSGPLEKDFYDLRSAETPEALNVQRLVTRMGQDGFKLHKAIKSLRLGQTVCGYGAPAQLTTTCYALGIMRDDIAFIVDDNPLKQGRFTPGRHIPILPPSALYERKPDACVIFSANFSEDIRARHREYRGEWIEI